MTPTITIEIPALSEPLVRRLLALHEELSQRALSAPDGTVFDACEAAIVDKGRDLNAHILADAVAQRVAAAEKKGRPCGPAAAAASRRTADPRAANSSVPSASSP
ncbi:MAG TPA: hypothetical protein VH643_16165 [Gemmataceae bacterium]|jgi:hypothetical protein